MITEKEYKLAIKTIIAYRDQINNDVSKIIEIKNDKSKLLKRGQRIKILWAHPSSDIEAGDILTVIDSYYNWRFEIDPVIIVEKSGNRTSRISKDRGWNYEVIS